MEAVVKKWGNSLGIRIPNILAKGLSLRDGSYVNIDDTGNAIVIRPLKKNKLSEMIKLINKENLHDEINTGEPVGKEIW